MIDVPKLLDLAADGPAWIAVTAADGSRIHPMIKCRCGRVIVINHLHVSAEGIVRGYWDAADPRAIPSSGKGKLRVIGCGWRADFRLLDYDGGAFLPVRR